MSDSKIIDLKFGPSEDGTMTFTHVGDKWRCAEYEARKAEADDKRIARKLKNKGDF